MSDSPPLTREQLAADPFEQFARWFAEAVLAVGLENAQAMCVSTLDPDGFPDGRIILLKHADAQGFVFYTNAHSVKGRSLDVLPKTALTFYWNPLQRQVRVQGTVEKVADDEADAYFQSRARLSQIGAWASEQSGVVPDRATLDQRVKEYEKKYPQTVPRPDYWTGFRVTPLKIEFWQARPNRLHDRFLYRKNQSCQWQINRLYP